MGDTAEAKLDASASAGANRAGTRPAADATGATAALAHRWLALLAAVLVLGQAVLVGQGLYGGDLGLIGVHGWVGNAGFLVVLGLLAAAFLGWRGGRLSAADLLLSAALVLLIVAQLGLGYSGRRSAVAAAWHLPNGVLIFGVMSAIVARAFATRR